MPPAAPARPARRRADALRNEQAILAAGTEVLAAHPQATMTDIADAAGLGRATLYRHHASREDLIAAIGAAAEAEIAQMVDGLPDEGPVLPALEALLRSSVVLGTRYRYLVLHPRQLEATPVALAAMDRFAAVVARGQQQGEIDDALDPVLVSHLFLGLVTAVLVPVALGQIDEAAALTQAAHGLGKLLAA